jgi:hypothetical protein
LLVLGSFLLLISSPMSSDPWRLSFPQRKWVPSHLCTHGPYFLLFCKFYKIGEQLLVYEMNNQSPGSNAVHSSIAQMLVEGSSACLHAYLTA